MSGERKTRFDFSPSVAKHHQDHSVDVPNEMEKWWRLMGLSRI